MHVCVWYRQSREERKKKSSLLAVFPWNPFFFSDAPRRGRIKHFGKKEEVENHTNTQWWRAKTSMENRSKLPQYSQFAQFQSPVSTLAPVPNLSADSYQLVAAPMNAAPHHPVPHQFASTAISPSTVFVSSIYLFALIHIDRNWADVYMYVCTCYSPYTLLTMSPPRSHRRPPPPPSPPLPPPLPAILPTDRHCLRPMGSVTTLLN